MHGCRAFRLSVLSEIKEREGMSVKPGGGGVHRRASKKDLIL
jgi:hypothetical protein